MKTVTEKEESIFHLLNSHCYAKVLCAFVTSYMPAPAVLKGTGVPDFNKHVEHLRVSAKACLIGKTVCLREKRRIWLVCFVIHLKYFLIGGRQCRNQPLEKNRSCLQKHLHEIFYEPLPESCPGVRTLLLQPFPAAVSFWLGLHLPTRSQNLGKVGWKGSLSIFSPNNPLRVRLLVLTVQVSWGFVWKQLGDSTIFLDYVFQCYITLLVKTFFFLFSMIFSSY